MSTSPLSPPRPRGRWLHAALLAVLTVALCALYTQEPGFGDDLTYWTTGFKVHEQGVQALNSYSFHDLRWPVWGVSYLLQSVFGFNMIAYTGVAAFYMALGAVVCFILAWEVTRSLSAAWAAGLVFFFHPLLDSLVYRPMPDMPEGVWGGLVMLAWWRLMHSERRGASVGWAAGLGLLVFLMETNRITGVFIIPVLGLCTLLFFRPRFHWLLIAGAFSAGFYVAEMGAYKWRYDDWLHNLHAHQNAKGVAGTEPVPFWQLPIRFLPALWEGDARSPWYCACAVLGFGLALLGVPRAADRTAPEHRESTQLARVIAVWFVAIYLLYSFAPQSFSPWRPMVRAGDRFIASITVPMSVLVVVTIWFIGRSLVAFPWGRRAARWAPLGVVVLAGMLMAQGAQKARPFFTLGWLPRFHAYMQQLPPGTKVFTHDTMRSLAFLANDRAARQLTWLAPRVILYATPETERMIAEADEFWYARKLMWVATRKQLDRQQVQNPQLASVFAKPAEQWHPRMVLMGGDNPDLIFQQRRAPGVPVPPVLELSSPLLRTEPSAPPLPFQWTQKNRTFEAQWAVPAELRGQLVRLETQATSETVEACNLHLLFRQGGKLLLDCQIKPYLYGQLLKDFFVFQIPPTAETCELRFRLEKKVPLVTLWGARLQPEGPPLISEFPAASAQ